MIDDEMRRAVRDELHDARLDFLAVKMPDKHDRLDPHRKKMPHDIAAGARGKYLDQRRKSAVTQQALQGREFAHRRRRQQILHANPHHRRALALQVKCMGVGCKSRFRETALHALDRLRLESRLSVQHPRDRGARQADMLGKFLRRANDGTGRIFIFCR